MSLPFTTEDFLLVFARYNQAIWPAQTLAYLLGFGALWTMRRRPAASTTPTFILSALWLWTGIAYHFIFFSASNPAAYIFGGLLMYQGHKTITTHATQAHKQWA